MRESLKDSLITPHIITARIYLQDWSNTMELKHITIQGKNRYHGNVSTMMHNNDTIYRKIIIRYSS